MLNLEDDVLDEKEFYSAPWTNVDDAELGK